MSMLLHTFSATYGLRGLQLLVDVTAVQYKEMSFHFIDQYIHLFQISNIIA